VNATNDEVNIIKIRIIALRFIGCPPLF